MTIELRHHHLELGSDKIATVTINMTDKAANVLTSEFLLELSDTVKRLSVMGNKGEVKGLILRSGKPKMFVAGASIDEIAAVTDAAVASNKARGGQSLFQEIEDLPFPSVASIDGPCLGGGMELALACTYRVAAEESHVRLALPEVRLGIIPGFGGTQRLPKLIGFLPGMDLIVTGKSLDARRAYRLGLVDDYAPSPILDDVARKWVTKGPRTKPARKTPGWHKILEGVGPLRHMIVRKAREKVLANTSGFYPAPLAALEVLDETFGTKKLNGYETEARNVGELAVTPICKSLIQIFQATEEIRRTKFDSTPLKTRKIGVLGAGVMGAGIAQLASAKGKAIRLRDITTPLLSQGLKTIHGLNEKQRKRRRIEKREVRDRFARIAPTTDWSGFRQVDMVIEAVVENIDIKKEVFAELDRRTKPEAVLATNTSALSITEIASATKHPERVIGLHFFNPVHRMPLVEIVKGKQTSAQTIATTFAFATEIGKTPIVVADRPGFFVNRVLGLYLNEACLAAEDGIPIDEIDKGLKAFGMPMGPFELMDEIGLDVAEKVGLYLTGAFSHFPAPSRLLREIRSDGRTGKKGGKGFYVHDKKGKRVDTVHVAETLKTLTQDRDFKMETDQYEQLVDRLVLAMVNEAARALEEGVVETPRDVEIGMIMGTGFAPFRGGLFAYAKARGLDEVQRKLVTLAETYGNHFKPVTRIRALDTTPAVQMDLTSP